MTDEILGTAEDIETADVRFNSMVQGVKEAVRSRIGVVGESLPGTTAARAKIYLAELEEAQHAMGDAFLAYFAEIEKLKKLALELEDYVPSCSEETRHAA